MVGDLEKRTRQRHGDGGCRDRRIASFCIKHAFPVVLAELGKHITNYSNEIATQSLCKFRDAIGELAFYDGVEKKQQNVHSYLTWRELIHGSYFEIPQFRLMMAETVATVEGFKRRPAFESS